MWENRFKNNVGNDCLVSVDGTDICFKGKVLPNGKPDKHFYSYKYKAPSLCYEIALCIRSSDIVWIAGPYLPGVYNGHMNFREGLRGELADGKS